MTMGCSQCNDGRPFSGAPCVHMLEAERLPSPSSSPRVCTCPAEQLGAFWRLRRPGRPGVTWHVACGRVRIVERHPRPLVPS